MSNEAEFTAEDARVLLLEWNRVEEGILEAEKALIKIQELAEELEAKGAFKASEEQD